MSNDPDFGEDAFARMLREEAAEVPRGTLYEPPAVAAFRVLAVHQGQGVAILRVDSDEGRELLASLRPGARVEVRAVVDDGGAEP